VPPDRIAPPMTGLAPFDDYFFVDLDAQARASR
jgi:hypothetical protein